MSDTEKLAIPTIHLNGTSAESLKTAIEDAYCAIGEAKDKLRETAPNGRDYYVQKDNPIRKAQDEHYARLVRLESVREELVQILDGILAQEQERERLRGFGRREPAPTAPDTPQETEK